MDGELERNFSLFLVGAFAGVLNFGAEVVGVAFFCWQKIKLVRSWWGKHQNGGKITWRGNGGEIPRKGPSQLSPYGGVGASGLTEAHLFSNPGELGRQDWSLRSIRHVKHALCGRLCRPSSPKVCRVCLLCVCLLCSLPSRVSCRHSPSVGPS